jgi:hypothetical protein
MEFATNRGEPQVLMIEVTDATLEETPTAIRQVEALRLITKIQMQSVESGTNLPIDDEIQEEITAVRSKRSAEDAVI